MKKLTFVLALLFLTGTAFGDSLVTSMTAITTPASTDLVYVVANPGTTPVDRKLTFGNLATYVLGNGYLTFTGPTTATRTKTLRDASDTILELGGSYTPTGTWNWGTATVTWPTFNQNTSGTSAGLSGTPNITVGTISAGASGFAVDADGDVTAKSVNVSKVSGTAGLVTMYEANSTDTSYIGWMGPASISESFSFQFSNTQPTAGQAMVFAVPTGTGDPNGNKVSAQTWVTPATLTGTETLTNKSITSLEVDGSADASLTAAQVSSTIVTNYGQAASDVALTLPTAAAGYNALFVVGTAQSNKWGVRAGTNDKIYLIAADGTISAGSDNGYARMTAAQVGQSFACWTFKTGSSAYDWQCKAISIGTSTFAAN
jgi:hypothetical protein